MYTKQRTISKSVSFSGIGLHTGESSTITFNPADENYGLKFIRTDLEKHIEIPALIENVVDLARGTTLGIDGIKVHTVEHVLAALVGLQIDNCRIELSGIEPPVGDGSSMPYVKVLLESGFQEQEAEREIFTIDETIYYKNDEKEVDIVALPTDDFRVTVMVDYHNPALGSQHTGLFNLEKEFVDEFASARTFCFLTELQMLKDNGLIKGGQIDNAIVIIDKNNVQQEELEKLKTDFNLDNTPIIGTSGFLDNRQLRFKNEPARHKLLDMLGDMALIGVPIKAQILAARPGHASNIEFARKIRALYLKYKKVRKYQPKRKGAPLLDIKGLMKIMPHRYPFLLIDKVIDYDSESKTVTSIKNVTFNEEFFQGHFPNNPVMPGVLITESMAQSAAMLILQEVDDLEKKLVVFMGIKNAKFRKPVVPGDQLVLHAQLLSKRFNTYMLKVFATVDGQKVAEAELQTAVIDKV